MSKILTEKPYIDEMTCDLMSVHVIHYGENCYGKNVVPYSIWMFKNDKKWLDTLVLTGQEILKVNYKYLIMIKFYFPWHSLITQIKLLWNH